MLEILGRELASRVPAIALLGCAVAGIASAEGSERQLAAAASGSAVADGEPPPASASLQPDRWRHSMTQALERDDPEAVSRLLRSVSPADEELAEAVANLLHSAASKNSQRVAAALIEQGYEVSAAAAGTSYTPLHAAAKYEALATAELLLARGADVNANSDGWTPLLMALRRDTRSPTFAVARLLVEHGANVNARTDLGWTPLLMALLDNADSPAFAVARMLMERGANVNARTALFGWTPLHLAASHAASGDELALAVVQALLERGADVNVRTRIGGWTPVRAATKAGDANESVLELLRAAGGEDGGYDDAPELSIYQNGSVRWPPSEEMRQEWGMAPAADVGTSAVKGRFTMPFFVPSRHFFSQYAVQGAFTAPRAAERLLFEDIGVRLLFEPEEIRMRDIYGPYSVAALEDKQGNVRPLFAYNYYTHFVGICRDPVTDTDTVMFEHRYDGSCCPWADRVYLHYDEDAGDFLKVLYDEDLALSTAAPDEQGVCHWRKKKAALAAYREATDALTVGELPKLAADGTTQALPTRVIPSAVVDEQLATLRQLPEDVVEVWEVQSAPRWRVVGVEYHRRPEGEFSYPCEGAVLVWDATLEQWRSIYDCADLEAMEIHDDMLVTALNDAGCLWRRLENFCYMEVDLATSEARLWDDPSGNAWIDRRQRPTMRSMNDAE